MLELMDQFISHLRETKKISQNTEVSYLRDLKQLADYAAPKDVKQLTEKDLTEYIAYLEDIGKSPATVSRAIASMKAFFLYLTLAGYIENNPAVMLKAPKVKKSMPHVLSDAETHKLIEQADGNTPKSVRDRAMLELLYSTGIRVSELIHIEVDDINLRGETVTIRGNKSSRDVAFGKVTRNALRKYIDKSRTELLGSNESPYLFVNCSGEEMSRQGFWKIIKYYGKKAGIEEEITPHTFRHSLAAHLAQEGTELSSIQHIMGHSDVSTTRMYARLM